MARRRRSLIRLRPANQSARLAISNVIGWVKVWCQMSDLKATPIISKSLTRRRPKRGQKWPQARKTCSALWWEQIKISPFRWKSDVMSTMWGFKQNFSNRKCVAMVTPERQWGHFWPHFGRACNTFSEIVINDIFYISGTVIDRNVIPNLFLIFFGSRKSSRL